MKTLLEVQNELQTQYPNKKLSDEWFFIKNGFYMVWDRNDRIVTELWNELEPTKFFLCEFRCFAFSGSLNYWRPCVGASEKVLVIRRFYLCGNDVGNLLDYVNKGYAPLSEVSCEQKLTKDPHIKHIQLL